MKKILVILACVAMLFSFASCNDGSSVASSLNPTAAAAGLFEEADITTMLSSLGTTFAAADVDVSGVAADRATFTISDDTTGNRLSLTVVKEAESADKAATWGENGKIGEATIDASMTVTDPAYIDRTLSFNGKIVIDGTLTTVEKDGTASIAITTATLSDEMNIYVDGQKANTVEVYEAVGIDSAEKVAAKGVAKAYVDKINEAYTTASATAANFVVADSNDKVTVTLKDVTAEGTHKVNVTITIPGKFGDGEDKTKGGTFTPDSTKVSISSVATEDLGNLEFVNLEANFSAITVPEGGVVTAAPDTKTLTIKSVTLDGYTFSDTDLA